jgi:hypothetical protein
LEEPVATTFRVHVDLLDPEGGQQQLQKVGNYPLINMVSYPRRLEYSTDQLITRVNYPWMTFYL